MSNSRVMLATRCSLIGDFVTRYHLNQRRGQVYIADVEGGVFDCLDDARREAVAGIRDAIGETVRFGFIELSWCFEIADESGIVVESVTFRDALDIRT